MDKGGESWFVLTNFFNNSEKDILKELNVKIEEWIKSETKEKFNFHALTLQEKNILIKRYGKRCPSDKLIGIYNHFQEWHQQQRKEWHRKRKEDNAKAKDGKEGDDSDDHILSKSPSKSSIGRVSSLDLKKRKNVDNLAISNKKVKVESSNNLI